MNFKPVDKNVKDLLISGHQFEIPRFQRAYSWEKRHYAEFLRDIISNLKISNGTITPESYFVGTMLFIGNFLDSGNSVIKVVDGQQRLTTITILFSVLSEMFKKSGENQLSQLVFKYITAPDDNGQEVRILKTVSNYPYFAYFVQDYTKSHDTKPETEEEENIKLTYDFFVKELSEKKIRQTLKNTNGAEEVDALNYTEILKAIRDQVLNCSFISISTESESQANRIFEILNAKGKRLDEVDLIKNKIFEVANTVEPVDFANEQWKEIQSKIDDIDTGVGMATFYRHFWSAKFKRSTSGRLYEDFKTIIKPRNEIRYRQFLEEMNKYADYYAQIINPRIETYNNRQEYQWLVQSLKALSETFSIVQVRVPLMALIYAKQNDLINMAHFKKAVIYLENFHFAYNAIVSNKGNKLDSIYSAFSIKLCTETSKERAHRLINDELIGKLETLFPSYSAFKDNFIAMQYSKDYLPSNVKVKYALNKINAYFSNSDVFIQGMTVEHILPEAQSERNRSIGNLIMLESTLNNMADNAPYDQKIQQYKESRSSWIAEFIEKYPAWEEAKFEERAKELAEIYFTKIFNRKIDADSNE